MLLVAPFWISYLMRMFAWTNLLADGGYAARLLDVLRSTRCSARSGCWTRATTGSAASTIAVDPRARLRLRAVPDPAAVRVAGPDRPAADRGGPRPRRVARRARSGASCCRCRCAGTLGGIVLIALPMFGDYYTPDLMSGSPRTAMLGNTINNYVQGGPDKALGAALTLLLSRSCWSCSCSITCARRQGREGDPGMKAWFTDPWGKPRFLVAWTWLYVVWSLVPVLHRDPVRVQRRPLAHVVAGVLAALVLDATRLGSVGRTTDAAQRAGALARAGRARDADRDAARDRAGDRPAALAQQGRQRGERADAAAAGDAGAGDSRVDCSCSSRSRSGSSGSARRPR